ncbi:DUF1835 domain-containing protein [Paenibacillus puerhi]|uniref:DUF1835 domain-containing protein n=1 Tax=Paenibacillus puerhi TaxID=2692622 RepID=UPI00135B0E8D|nr:DUF1835 domain-containing protein [Paenibacillus puerhi]
MLHIVNGDSVAEKLRQGIVQGDILVWREVYPHGPVAADPAARDHRTVRASYLEQTLGIPPQEYMQISEAQEKVLADFHHHEEIVCWFEHDLFDQTMLCYLLHWFSGQSLKHTKLSLLSIGEFPGIELFRGLGQLSLEQMKTLSGAWVPIGAQELESGSAWWQAYTSADPSSLQPSPSTDTSSLPFARAAFQSHLSRFPSTHNGLGIVEQTTLEMLHAGIRSSHDLFDQVGGKLHLLGMGDLQYGYVLKKMSQAPYPLLQLKVPQDFPSYKESPLPLRGNEIEITDLGRRVLEGEMDWIDLQGIDEWYGGVHLQGVRPRWRWDASSQCIVEVDRHTPAS